MLRMARLDELRAGDSLPERTFEPNEVELFFFNASLWNGHRIHYDAPYSESVEDYPAIVVDGPLQGDWLSQVVTDWLGPDGRVLEFGYSNRGAAFVGERLTAGGEIESVEPRAQEVKLRLTLRKDDGTLTTTGEARVRLETP